MADMIYKHLQHLMVIVHQHSKLDLSAVLSVMVNIVQIGGALWDNQATTVR